MTAIFVFLGGCGLLEYKPSKEVFTDVPLPETGITLDLTASGDTLLGYGVVRIRYKVNLQGKKFFRTNLYVGTSLVAYSESLSEIEIDTRALPQGVHTLTLEALAHSGTGSLADRLDAEFVVDRITGHLWVDNGSPGTVAISRIEPYDGRLMVEWERYNRPNFDSYRVVRSFSAFERPPPWGSQVVAVITNRTTTRWVDPDFVGGDVSYRVEVVAGQLSGVGDITNFSDAGPEITRVERNADRTVRLAWSQSRYPKNFRSYNLMYRTDHDSYMAAHIDGIADTSFVTPPLLFGALHRYQVVTRGTISEWQSDAVEVSVDERVPGVSNPQWVQSGLVVTSESGIHLLDLETKAVMSSLPLQEHAGIAATASGSRLFALQGDRVLELDIHSLQPIATTNLRSIVGFNLTANHLRVSDNGLISVVVYALISGTQHHRGTRVIDLATQNVITSVEGWDAWPIINPAGNYILHLDESSETTYRVENGGLEEIRRRSRACAWGQPAFVAEDLYAQVCDETAVLRSATGTADDVSFPVPGAGAAISVDHAGRMLGILSQDERSYSAYDALEGTHVITLDVDRFGGPYRIVNGEMWSGRGFYRDLQ